MIYLLVAFLCLVAMFSTVPLGGPVWLAYLFFGVLIVSAIGGVVKTLK